MRRRIAIFVALALAATACGGSGDQEIGEGRVLVSDSAGTIYTAAPDATDRRVLAISNPQATHRQPTWSPDGSEVAWVEVADPALSTLHVVDSFGEGDRGVVVPAALFYLMWSPVGDRLIGLGSAGSGLDVILVDVGGDLRTTSFDSGQPYYFDWSPDGERLITHVSRVMSERTIDGGARVIAEMPGTFQAPAWDDDGSRMVYAIEDSGGQTVVAEDAESRDLTPLLTFRGTVRFALSHGRLAYLAVFGGDGGATTAAFGGPQPAADEQLTVLDLDTGLQVPITDEIVFAFEWSPDGSALLYMTLAPETDPPMVRWNVWDGTASTAFVAFESSLLYFREYLPFFDQYERSQTRWSPRSDAFAFEGVLGDGTDGVFVQHLNGGAPVRIGPGEFVTWGAAGG